MRIKILVVLFFCFTSSVYLYAQLHVRNGVDSQAVENLLLSVASAQEAGKDRQLATGLLQFSKTLLTISGELNKKNGRKLFPEAVVNTWELKLNYSIPGIGMRMGNDHLLSNAGICLQRARELALKTAAKSLVDSCDAQIALVEKLQKEPLNVFGNEAATDSFFNRENSQNITKLLMQYDFNKKQDSIKADNDKKEALAKEEIIYQHKIRNILIGGLILLVGFAVLLYRSLKISKKQKIDIQHQKERAERSERFKQQFLANMSHEIRTPMNAVSGMTEILLEKDPRQDQVRYLKVIAKSSELLLHLVNDILDLSKIEVGKLELENIDFSLTDTLTQVKETLAFKAEEKGLQLVLTIDRKIQDVLAGDPFRLNQVLINLGGNAVKFTDRGSVEISVKELERDDKNIMLKFSVTDTGIGIPADKIQHLFENFRQVNISDSRKFGGSGLGLSISKQLVELQGGTIDVESKQGLGTTFTFVLTYPFGSKERLELRERNERQADGQMLDGLRILLADDNEYNRFVVTETLRLKSKLHIHEAQNGLEAIRLMEKNDYDIVLMDVQMPEMNGLEATRHIRNNLPEGKNKIPVIALTASILRHDIEMCYEHGMNSYVPKPFKAWQLIAAIADLTGRKNSDNNMQIQKEIPLNGHHSTGITNLAFLEKFCEGNTEKMKKYVSMYLSAVPQFTEKVNQSMAENNLTDLGITIHSFKPKWMMMGMKQSTELAIKVEALCRDEGEIKDAWEYVLLLLENNNKSVTELQDKC